MKKKVGGQNDESPRGASGLWTMTQYGMCTTNLMSSGKNLAQNIYCKISHTTTSHFLFINCYNFKCLKSLKYLVHEQRVPSQHYQRWRFRILLKRSKSKMGHTSYLKPFQKLAQIQEVHQLPTMVRQQENILNDDFGMIIVYRYKEE